MVGNEAADSDRVADEQSQAPDVAKVEFPIGGVDDESQKRDRVAAAEQTRASVAAQEVSPNDGRDAKDAIEETSGAEKVCQEEESKGYSYKELVALACDNQGIHLWREVFPAMYHAELAYDIVEMRDAARKGKLSEQILSTPFSLDTVIKIVEENEETIKDLTGGYKNFAERKRLLKGLKNECVANFEPYIVKRTEEMELTAEELRNALVFIKVDDEDEHESMVHYIALSHSWKSICVVFRGSQSLKDWAIDLTFTMKPLDGSSVIFSKRSSDRQIKVHKGFYEYLLEPKEGCASEKPTRKIDSIFDTVRDLAAENPDYELKVYGHSLGAALSTLFSFCAASKTDDLGVPSPVKCINIGSPYVGDQNFCNAFEDLEEKGKIVQLRIHNDADPIPKVPKRDPVMYGIRLFNPSFRYRHVGMSLQLYGKPTLLKMLRMILNPTYWFLLLAVYVQYGRRPSFVLRRRKQHNAVMQMWLDLLSDFHMFLLSIFLCCEGPKHGANFHSPNLYRERLLAIGEHLSKMTFDEIYQKQRGILKRG